MSKRLSLLFCAAWLAWMPSRSEGQDRVIDVRQVQPRMGNTFDALWNAYRKADQVGDKDLGDRLFQEIRRLRIERNVRSLEEIGLALVGRGLARLEKGERDAAEQDFRNAIGLDPYLSDAYFGLALAEAKKGPLGFLPAAKDTLAGLTARLSTPRGEYYLLLLGVSAGLLAALAIATVFGTVMLLRHGALLQHDLEETFGPARGRPVAIAVYSVLILLPALTLQGYAWLPLWWLALLFIYAALTERLVTVLLLLATLLAGPLTKVMESRILAAQNPLFRAAVAASVGAPDPVAQAELERARAKNPDDRDVAYLLAAQYKKSGNYDEAAALYREILRADADDPIALNNLANLEFAHAEFQAAIARYKLGTESSAPAEILATFYYNLQLAHLQKFEFQAATEMRSQAERLDGRRIREYDGLWKYDRQGSGGGQDSAVVDLGLGVEDIWAKFAGAREGVGKKNVAGTKASPWDTTTIAEGVLNRFAGFLGLAIVLFFALSWWRGKKMFTMRCLKCGTPFCRRCHLGAAAAGLCTQCHHLFVVRDGVSGPARNQKLLEVQREDQRRERVFRALSLLSPGAGHLYAQRTAVGMLFTVAWYSILALALLAGRVIPITEASDAVSRPWGLGLAALALVVLYVTANRARPDFDVSMPFRRPARGRTA